MRSIQFNTALGLLVAGVLLMGAQFVLLTHPSLTHPLPQTVLSSSDTQHTQATGCHEESAPKHHAPQNHDCCAVGHLHAIGSAAMHVARASAVSPVNTSILLSASIEQTASQTSQVSDTGPPGSAVPIRV